jgi:predicted dienelactone hydrolase
VDKFPLIVFSHGLTAVPDVYGVTFQHLVSHGFVTTE